MQHSTYIRRLTVALILVFSYATDSSQAFSQTDPTPFTHPNLFVEIQDSVFMKRILAGATDTLSPDVFSAMFAFAMVHDSTCRTTYLFSECKHNNNRLKLETWEDQRLIHIEAEELSDSSRTKTFTIQTGDTVSFYRELSWYNAMTGRQDTANYVSTDTLDYTVELIEAGTGNRLAVLDSIGILPSPQPGRPVIYGTSPVMSKVRYGIPSSLNGKTAFVRVRLYTRGNGAYFPVRNDQISIDISGRLNDPNWGPYRSLFVDPYCKRIIDFDSDASPSLAGYALDVRKESGSDGRATITYSAPADVQVSVAVYNSAGAPVFSIINGAFDGENYLARYQFPTSGVYFIALLADGSIIKTEKLVIAR